MLGDLRNLDLEIISPDDDSFVWGERRFSLSLVQTSPGWLIHFHYSPRPFCLKTHWSRSERNLFTNLVLAFWQGVELPPCQVDILSTNSWNLYKNEFAGWITIQVTLTYFLFPICRQDIKKTVFSWSWFQFPIQRKC